MGDEQYNYQQYRDPYPYYDRPPDHQHPEYYATEEYDYQDHYQPPNHAQIHVPPPEVQAEEGLSEKERLRRAEERLLPSQPPIDENAPSSSRTVVPPIAPSVPPDDAEEDLYGPDDATPQEAPRVPPPSHQHSLGDSSWPIRTSSGRSRSSSWTATHRRQTRARTATIDGRGKRSIRIPCG